MFEYLKKFLQKASTTNSYQSSLERFIASKKPTTPVELEHLIKEFDRRGGSRYGF